MRKKLKFTKITSMLLCMVLLFSSIPFTTIVLDAEPALTESNMPDQAFDTVPTVEESPVVDTEPIGTLPMEDLKLGEKSFAELQSMSVDIASLPTFINAEVALEKKHVHRVKEQEGNLHTVVYQN